MKTALTYTPVPITSLDALLIMVLYGKLAHTINISWGGFIVLMVTYLFTVNLKPEKR